MGHSGNITMDDIIAAARIMAPRSMAKEFSGTMKEVLGTAQSWLHRGRHGPPRRHRWHQRRHHRLPLRVDRTRPLTYIVPVRTWSLARGETIWKLETRFHFKK